MSARNETACVGCRFAKWYTHDNRYGVCGHPAVEQEQRLPMVMHRATIFPISRTSMFENPGECAAKEVSP